MSSAVEFARNAKKQFSPSASIAIVVPSILSGIAVLFILAHVGVTAFAQAYRRIFRGAKGERIFVATPLGVYIVSLLFSTLVSAIGAGVSLQWVQSRSIFAGTTCSSQAMILQMGSLATAFFVLYISCHALNAVVIRRPVAKWVMALCVVALWSLVLFLDLAGPLFVPRDRRAAFYGPAGSWCWITSPYSTSQKVMLAVPMLIVTAICIAVFAIIFVHTGKNSPRSIDGLDTKALVSKQLKEKGKIMVAKYLMWYPIVYVLFNFPLAVVALSGKASSTNNGVVFAEVLYGFQGMAFAALYVFTHRVFGGRPWRFGVGSYTLQDSAIKNGDTESFAALEKALSPTTPKVQQWKPAASEWSAPLDRAASTRSNRYYEGAVITSPAPPMPSITQIVTQPSIPDMEPTRDSASSLDTVVELPEPSVVTMSPPLSRPLSPPRPLARMNTLPSQPSPAMRSIGLPAQPSPAMRSVALSAQPSPAMRPIVLPAQPQQARPAGQPLQSALSKRGAPANLARKKSNVQFAAALTIVHNMSPLESPYTPSEDPEVAGILVSLPARPAPVAAAAAATSPTRKPVPKYEPAQEPEPEAEISAPTPMPQPLAPAPTPRRKLPQPMIVIPGRSQERDTVFVMETPISTTATMRPFTELDMPLPILTALKGTAQDVPSDSPVKEPSPIVPRSAGLSPRRDASLDSNGSLRYDSDDGASSILLYYAAEPSPPMRSVSPVLGDAKAGIPSVAVVAGSETSRETTPVNPNPHTLHKMARPGTLAPPPPAAKRVVAPKPGYL